MIDLELLRRLLENRLKRIAANAKQRDDRVRRLLDEFERQMCGVE